MRSREDLVAGLAVDAATEVHRTIGGPGLLESVYEEALCWELRERGLSVDRQKAISVVYKGQTLASPLRVDLIVDGRVIVECKAVAERNDLFAAQALTYLRILNLRLALVINFGTKLVKDGIERVINGY